MFKMFKVFLCLFVVGLVRIINVYDLKIKTKIKYRLNSMIITIRNNYNLGIIISILSTNCLFKSKTFTKSKFGGVNFNAFGNIQNVFENKMFRCDFLEPIMSERSIF